MFTYEICIGGDLAYSLEDDTWQTNTSLRMRIRIMHDVAVALSHLHEQGFVHRDVKPHNVLLRFDVSAVGMARRHESYNSLDVDTDEDDKNAAPVAKLCDFGTSLRIDLHTTLDRQLFGFLDDSSEAVGKK